MLNDLLLLSGNDIPFVAAQVNIHQPTIKEIAYIGEEAFFTGCQLLNFSKDILNEEDKSNLEQLSNFEVLMSIINDKNAAIKKQKVCLVMVLTLIFPTYQVKLSQNEILFLQDNQVVGKLTKDNFEEFKEIISTMFCLKSCGEDDYNPSGEFAKKIAEKLKERQRRLAEQKGSSAGKIAIFSRYISILSVGEQKDMNSLLQYTVYQLFDEFQRYEMKVGFDYYIQAKMAGAKDLKEVDDWMKDIHS